MWTLISAPKGLIIMFNLKEKAILNEKVAEIEMNISNNYKDLARAAFEDFEKTLAQMKENGLSERVYKKYKKIYDEYARKFEGYSHRDFFHS